MSRPPADASPRNISLPGSLRAAPRTAAVEEALHYVAPVGQKQEYISRALAVVGPFLPVAAQIAA